MGVEDDVEVIKKDLTKAPKSSFPQDIEVVMTNPPFGASKNEGIDSTFIKLAGEITKGPFYVIHKSACRDFLGKFAGEIGRDF